MSYISATTRKEQVLVWERNQQGERKLVVYSAPRYFYVEDPQGKYTSIYGQRVRKEEFDNKFDFDEAKQRYIRTRHRLFESDIPAELRILSNVYYNRPAPRVHVSFYDIEVDYDPEIGFASPSNPYAPINSIAILHKWLNKLVVIAVPPSEDWFGKPIYDLVKETAPTVRLPDNTEIILVKDERELLINVLAEFADTDIICGWNSDFFDAPYMTKRIECVLGKTGLKYLSFPEADPPRFKTVKINNREYETVVFSGRVSLDYMALYKKFEQGERASFALAAIEQEVGLNLPKLEYTGSLYRLYRENFPFFIRYNIRDCEILGGFEDTLGYVELANQICHLSTVRFEDVLGTIKTAEFAIINYCHRVKKQVVPDYQPPEEDRSIQGALVLYPQIGLHEWIGSIDINSLYPSSIRSINISPETLRGQFTSATHACHAIANKTDEILELVLEDGTTMVKTAKKWTVWLSKRRWAVSGYGTVFDQSQQGIIPSVLADWYDRRKMYQKKKKESTSKQEREYYDRLQYVYKIKLNSLYGALSNLFFKFYDLRMGESTTATGRMIVKHQCRQVAKIFDGKYDVEFPQYKTVKEAVERKHGPEVALNGPVFDGEFASESIIYGDTDSTFFKTYATSQEEAIKIADAIAEKVNASFPSFMRETFLCNEGFDTLIKCGREIVADRGIFVDKKRYMLHLVDVEGTKVNKMKVMGVDTKKTTLPKHVRETLNKFIEDFLTGEDWSSISRRVVDYKNELQKTKDIMLIGLPKGIDGVEKYTQEYKRDSQTRLPGHVAAAIHYNECLKLYQDKISMPITSGMKLRVFYLTQKRDKFKSIALPADLEVMPKWFIEHFMNIIDRDLNVEKLVDNPLQNILKAIGKKSPSKQDIFAESIFGF